MPRHVTHVPLRWRDVDTLSHVNNVVYLRYLQEARVDLFYDHMRRQGAPGLAEGMVVARCEIGYRRPLLYRPEPIRVETWVRRITHASVTLGYEIVDVDGAGDGAGRTVYAVASTVLVPYDVKAGRPRRIGPQERTILESLTDLAGPDPRGNHR